MLLLPEAAGPMDPAGSTPDRRSGSIRRTSNIDTARPDGLRGDLVVTARARDLRTGPDGDAEVVAEAELVARVARATQQLLSVETSPPLPALRELVGAVVGPGFRGRLARAVPGELEAGTLLHLLADDLPGAVLVSGYALQRGGALEPDQPSSSAPATAPSTPTAAPATSSTPAARGLADDLCAGWAHDATMMVTIRTKGAIPMALGPPAPRLERPDDPWAWHGMEPLPAHAMRRRRRLDLAPGYQLEVHFRDSHMDPDLAESVVHEYSVTGAVDGVTGTVTDMAARARVLPWMECPGAVASATRLVGMPVAELRGWVRREMTGATTCTHLNDTLRSLADVTALAGLLAHGGRPGPEAS
jgi:Protein of unknown function (DUF2889)